MTGPSVSPSGPWFVPGPPTFNEADTSEMRLPAGNRAADDALSVNRVFQKTACAASAVI